MKAEILTIGDELLRGEIVDTNKSFLSDRLLRFDVETRFHSSVCDDPDDMADAFRRAAARADVVLVSGGLGPTRDDITLDVLARTFGRGLVRHEPSLAAIRAFFDASAARCRRATRSRRCCPKAPRCCRIRSAPRRAACSKSAGPCSSACPACRAS